MINLQKKTSVPILEARGLVYTDGLQVYLSEKNLTILSLSVENKLKKTKEEETRTAIRVSIPLNN